MQNINYTYLSLSIIYQNFKTMKQAIFSLLFLFTGIMAQAATSYAPQIETIDTSFKAYVGVYKLDANQLSDSYTVTFEEGKLYGQANGYDKTELTKQTAAHSFKSGYGSDVIFIQETTEKPFLKVKLIVQGNEVFGIKE